MILSCFYCNVDSTPLLVFFVGMIGSLALGTLLCGIGLYMRGAFRDCESVKMSVFDAEERK